MGRTVPWWSPIPVTEARYVPGVAGEPRRDRRSELVDAGVRLLGQTRLEQVLAALETRAIAAGAAVSNGSFFHHFRTRRHYVQAVLDRFEQLWHERVRRLTAAIDLSNTDGARGVRPAAEVEWDALAAAGELSLLQHLLWVVRAAPVDEESSTRAGEILRAAYQELTEASLDGIERNIRAMGRELLAPFDARDLSVVTNAIAEGLQMRVAVDPDAIRPGLYADTMAVVLLGTTQPRIDRTEDAVHDDLDQLLRRIEGTPPSGAVTGGRPEAWRHIVDAAAPLFVDRSADEVRIAEVATAAGVAPSTVVHLFGSVRAVAACTWVRHIPELEAIATRPLDDDEDPLQRIEAVMRRQIELVRENPGAARAVFAQLLGEAVPHAAEPVHGIPTLLPLPDLLEPLARALRQRGRLRRHVEVHRLCRTLVHLGSMHALLFRDDPVDRIVDEVMATIFDGALASRSGV